MNIAIGATYKYYNDKGEAIVARVVEPETIDGRPYAKIDGTINDEPVKTMAVPIENIEMAFRNAQKIGD